MSGKISGMFVGVGGMEEIKLPSVEEVMNAAKYLLMEYFGLRKRITVREFNEFWESLTYEEKVWYITISLEEVVELFTEEKS